MAASAKPPYELHAADRGGSYDTKVRCADRQTLLRIRDQLNERLIKLGISRMYLVAHSDAEEWIEWRDEDETPTS